MLSSCSLHLIQSFLFMSYTLSESVLRLIEMVHHEYISLLISSQSQILSSVLYIKFSARYWNRTSWIYIIMLINYNLKYFLLMCDISSSLQLLKSLWSCFKFSCFDIVSPFFSYCQLSSLCLTVTFEDFSFHVLLTCFEFTVIAPD